MTYTSLLRRLSVRSLGHGFQAEHERRRAKSGMNGSISAA